MTSSDLARSDLVKPIASTARAIAQQRRIQRERGSRLLAYRDTPYEFVVEVLGESAWSMQRDIMTSVRDNRHTAVKACHGPGKALDLDTPLPTPTGWTTMRDVQAGDWVIDEFGAPVHVAGVSPVHERPSFVVRFDDGESIIASDDHAWQVLDLTQRKRHVLDWRERWADSVTRTTSEMAGSLRTAGGQLRWRVPNSRPVVGVETGLPVDPYVLGAWLGDGHTDSAAITVGTPDQAHAIAQFARGGVTLVERPSQRRDGSAVYRMDGGGHGTMVRALRRLGVVGAKHIPAGYLRAPVEARLALLRGLMDTDGFRTDGFGVGIDLTDQRLAADVAELVRSLGFKAHRRTRPTLYQGRTIGITYRLAFRPDREVFTLPRKVGNAAGRQSSRHTVRTIVAVEPLGARLVKCITVDSATSLYLAGAGFIPTHNSFIAGRIAAWWLSTHKAGEAFVVTSAPTAPQVRAILWREIGRAWTHGKLPGRVNQTEWWMSTSTTAHYLGARSGDEELVAFGRKPANPAGGAEGAGLTVTAFQGIHARYVLVILDEADGIPASLFNAAESLATNEGCRVLAIGNPDHGTSEFAVKCKPGSGWHVMTVSAFDTPNFTGEEVPPEVAAVLVSPMWVEERRREWGETSPLYVSKVLAQFPVDDTDGLIPWSWIARCEVDREFGPNDLAPVELGVDVGGGGDLTVVRERRGIRIGRMWTALTKESTEAVGLVRQAIRESGATRAKIDTIGIGWGVVGQLEEQRRNGEHACEIIGVNVASSPGTGVPQHRVQPNALTHQFAKVRDEVGWNMRTLVQNGAIDLRGIDDDTVTQMTAPRYGLDSSGRIKVEGKDETIKRLGHSPDKFDAVALSFYTPQRSGWADFAAEELAQAEAARAAELAEIERTRGT